MARKERKLTKAEERRLARFRAQIAAYEAEGWQRRDLTASPATANTLGSFYGILLCVPLGLLFVLLGGAPLTRPGDDFLFRWLGLFAALLVLTVVHELIHGLTWARFAKGGWKSIEFGVIWKSLNPYCTCAEPVGRGQYLTALLMPCLVLGVIPSIAACFTHSLWLLAAGLLMTAAAGGDLLIASLILKNKMPAGTLYLDHPTEIGLVCFTR